MTGFWHYVRWTARRLIAAVLLPFLLTFDLTRLAADQFLGDRGIVGTYLALIVTGAVASACLRALCLTEPAAAATAASATETRFDNHVSRHRIAQVDIQLHLTVIAVIRFGKDLVL